MAAVTALIDANVFYSMTVTDIVIQAARDGVFRTRWTDAIHAEWGNALLRNDPKRTSHALDKRRGAMDRAVPDALVTGFEPLIAALTLPDPDDRHVLAAAIHGQCSIIVTFNLKHFPASSLSPRGIAAVHPDAFLLDLLGRDREGMLACVAAMRARLKNPPLSIDEHLTKMTNAGLPRFAAGLVRFGSPS